ncbi:MAG: AI-2E family transporter [Candidatus Saccharibacteria bacterium]|nr:AI-2E family transporter [Candidatus Saccharibacteria bacterium]
MGLLRSTNKTITISTETIVKAILLTIGAFIVLRVVDMVAYQLQLLVISAFFALALNPAVTWASRLLKKGNRILATGIAYVVVLGGVLTFLTLFITPLVGQSVDFFRNLPQTLEESRQQETVIWQLVDNYNIDQELKTFAADTSNRANELASQALTAVTKVSGAVVSVLTVLVLTFMMLVEGPRWLERIAALQPEKVRGQRKRVAMRLYNVVTGYVNGQVLISAIGSGFYLIAMLIGSAITGVQLNAFGLAGIVFLFGLIPLIGNTLGALVVILVAAFSSLGLAIGLAIFAVVYQQIENITIQPHVQSKANQLTPLIVFSSAIVGAGLGGLFGAFAAIPVAGCIKVLFEEYYLKDKVTLQEFKQKP